MCVFCSLYALKYQRLLAFKVGFDAQCEHEYYEMPFVRWQNATPRQDVSWFAALAMSVLQGDRNAQHQQRRKAAEHIFRLASIRKTAIRYAWKRSYISAQDGKVLAGLAYAIFDR
jgi:hypothetical protein